MGLENFISDSGDNNTTTFHDNPSLDEEKLFVDNKCPECGNESEHVRNNEYRCTTDSSECGVLYYFTTDFDKDNA